MIDQLMASALLVCGITLAMAMLLNIAGAAVYDVRAARQRQAQRAHPHARRYRHRPLITVAVMARNDALTISRCLDSLRRGSYRKLQILIVDNASADTTAQTVRAYIAKYPKLDMRLVAKRRAALPHKAAAQAYRRYGRGELVMLLNADSSLDRQALRRMADQAAAQPAAAVLMPRLRPQQPNSVGGLLQTYLTLLGQRPGKAAGVFRRQYVAPANGVACRREAFGALIKTASGGAGERTFGLAIRAPYAYAHDAVINAPAAGSYYRLCRELYRSPFGRPSLRSARQQSLATLLAVCSGITLLLIPLLATYFGFLALSLKEPLFLVLSLGGLSLLLVFAVWEDEQLGLRRRLAYSLGIPVTYGLFYGLAWIRLAAACRTLVSGQAA